MAPLAADVGQHARDDLVGLAEGGHLHAPELAFHDERAFETAQHEAREAIRRAEHPLRGAQRRRLAGLAAAGGLVARGAHGEVVEAAALEARLLRFVERAHDELRLHAGTAGPDEGGGELVRARRELRCIAREQERERGGLAREANARRLASRVRAAARQDAGNQGFDLPRALRGGCRGELDQALDARRAVLGGDAAREHLEELGAACPRSLPGIRREEALDELELAPTEARERERAILGARARRLEQQRECVIRDGRASFAEREQDLARESSIARAAELRGERVSDVARRKEGLRTAARLHARIGVTSARRFPVEPRSRASVQTAACARARPCSFARARAGARSRRARRGPRR